MEFLYVYTFRFFNNCPYIVTGGTTVDIVLVPISHHFLCNYRLTLHHVAFEKFSHEVNWVGTFGVNFRPLQEIEAITGGGRIFDTGPFFARLRY